MAAAARMALTAQLRQFHLALWYTMASPRLTRCPQRSGPGCWAARTMAMPGSGSPRWGDDVGMVLVLMLNLPGRHRALVSPETAQLMVAFGHAKLLEDDRPRAPMREARPRRR
jgi:hypothetical protein